MNKLRKIAMATLILCVLLTNIVFVYAAKPTVGTISFPLNTVKKDSAGRVYVVPEGELSSTGYTVRVTISCSVYDNTEDPVAYFNGTKIGVMTSVPSAKNVYKLTWIPSVSQIGAAIGGPKELKIVAKGSSGSSSASQYVYIAGANKKYYDSLLTDWTFVEPPVASYNCLAYVLGNKSSWDWKWKNKNGTTRNATSAEVIDYLKSRGYKQTSSIQDAKIIAYGLSKDSIGHFALKTSSSTIIYKFGNYELISSNSLNPFKSCKLDGIEIGYGTSQLYFK